MRTVRVRGGAADPAGAGSADFAPDAGRSELASVLSACGLGGSTPTTVLVRHKLRPIAVRRR